MVGDHYRDKLPQQYPWIPDTIDPKSLPDFSKLVPGVAPTREEFNALKKDIEEIKELLKKAKELDEKTGQPDCEIDEKVALLKAIANMVGVDLEDVFGK